MSDWLIANWPALTVGGILGVVFIYISVRAGSIAHYRTRSEYDRGDWERPKNGEN